MSLARATPGALAVVAVAVAGCGGGTSHTAGSRAGPVGPPYSFTLPAGWQAGPVPHNPPVGGQTTRIFRGPPVAGHVPIVAVAVANLRRATTPAELARGARSSAATHKRLVSPLRATQLAGSPAYMFEAFDNSKAGLPLWGEEVITARGQDRISVVAFADRRHYAPARAAFEQILAGWRWR